MTERYIYRLDRVLCVAAVLPGQRFIWEHARTQGWRRRGQDVVFGLPDEHPDWTRAATNLLPELVSRHFGAMVTIEGPGGLPLCGRVPS